MSSVICQSSPLFTYDWRHHLYSVRLKTNSAHLVLHGKVGVGLVFVYQGQGLLLSSVRVQDLIKPGVALVCDPEIHDPEMPHPER